MSFAKSIFVITCLCLTVILLPVNGANPPSSGSASEASNQPNNQPNPAGKRQLPFKVGNVVSRTVQKVTGLTLVSEIVASQAAKAAVGRKVEGKVKVSVKTWSMTDLLAGKVKRVKVTIKNCSYKGTPIGDVQIGSTTPIWLRYFKHQDQRAGLRNPVLFTFANKITQSDVARALETKELAQSLRGLKLDLPGLGEQQLEVLNPSVKMTEGVISINGTLVTAEASADTGVPVTISGKIKLAGDDRIVLENMVVDSPDIIEPEKFAAFVEQLLNPLVNLQRFDKNNMALRLNSLKMSDGRLNAAGNLILAPRPQVSTKPTNEGNGTVPGREKTH